MLQPVFNDLSAAQPAADFTAAIDRMSQLIRLLRDAPDHGLDPGLRIPQTFHNLPLCPNYRVYDWLYDARVSREQTLFLLTLVTRSPYLDQAAEKIQERALLVELRVGELASDALRAAYLLEVPLVSFLDAPWDQPLITCEFEELVDDVVTPARPIQLRNISESGHFPVHADWIRERRKRSIETAGELWGHREKLFPHLEFCPSVEAQLMELRPSEPRFQQVLNKLFDLESYFSGWDVGPFDPDAFPKCNPASPETLERYSDHYTHLRSDSRKVVAGWHLYLTPGKGRLYFAADGANRRGIICHVGDKLPDVTYGRT